MLLDSMKRYPDSLLFNEKLIQYYREQHRPDSALYYTEQVLITDSLNHRFWYIYGTLHLENNDTTAALRDFENAAHLFPDENYFISLGSIYAVQKNPDALKVADFIEKNNPNTPRHGWFLKGLYYSYSGNKTEAIKWFDKCIDLSHTDMDAYLEKGIALYDLGRYAESVTVLEKATTLQNNFETGYYYMGRSLEKTGDTEKAKKAYQTALLFDRNYTEAKDALTRLNK